MILTEELDKAMDLTGAYLDPAAKVWTIRDPELRTFLEQVSKTLPVINYSVGAEYQWQALIEFSAEPFRLNLRLIKDWEYEQLNGGNHSGIRCLPEGITDGWIYFSFWPGGYVPEETDRYYAEGSSSRYQTVASYPSSVQPPTSLDTRNAVWSYHKTITEQGDFAIINDGADSWFLEYKDQISDMMTYMNFSVQ